MSNPEAGNLSAGRLVVSPSPHIHSGRSTTEIMRDVLIALAPAAVASVIVFGWRAALVIAVCIVSAVFFEWGFQKLTKRRGTIGDLSAAVTGVILAFNLPASIPLWQAALGSAIAIILVKQLFGGIGKNFANPAITARIALFLAFSRTMTSFSMGAATSASPAADAITGATPLALAKIAAQGGEQAASALAHMPSKLTLFLGNHAGCLGEVSALALVIGFAFLLLRRVISWETPVVYVAVVFGLSAAFGRDPVDAVLSGGLLLGAVFMATDYVTSPMSFKGRVVFAIGAGFFTTVIRVFGSYPEGVSFSILLMNILTPYIDKFTIKKPLGGGAA
ncbi:MAG: RnfABCDGE type electron transport complex subunit D [Oscillospiraceae bacterium]|jgi:electron transport complex protein RnfD|nr:RnfABCDGE type electron transport complex subunit D [Oscillospiraceae bacterium]